MTAPSATIHVTPELIEKFKAYHQRPENGAWGSMHIVLDDGNYEDGHVDFCVQYALENADIEGWELAKILRQLSITQRIKIAKRA